MRLTTGHIGQGAALAWVLAATTSCVPQQVEQAAAATRAVAEAAPLLRKLALDVPRIAPADMAAPAVATATGAAPPFVAAEGEEDRARALRCLADAVYYEAGNEPEDGKRAVAQVVLNRVRDRAFPSSVCGVVYQGSQRRTGCQFTFTCDGSLRRPRHPVLWERARAVAEAALGGYVYAPVGSATHYHADYVSPWWAPSLSRIGAVGRHVFYGWRGALGRALAFRQSYAGAEPGPVPGLLDAAASVARIALDGGESVTVHRGGAGPEAVAATARTIVSAGVRVHLSRRAAAADEAEGWSGGYEIDGAVIGEEGDPG